MTVNAAALVEWMVTMYVFGLVTPFTWRVITEWQSYRRIRRG